MVVSDVTTDNSTSSTDVTDKNLLDDIADWIWTVCPLIVFALGMFGNVMTIIILRKCQGHPSALDRYFLCLAVTDLCVNVMGPFRDWIAVVTDFRLFDLHDVTCKMGVFILNTAVACSVWIVVVMVTHRAMSVVWPHRVNLMCTAKTFSGIFVSIVVVFSIVYSHFLYGMEVSDGACMPKKNYLPFLNHVFTKIDTVLYSLLPFACLAISNMVLVVNLKTSVKDAGDQFAATEKQQNDRERKVNSITLTALVVSVSFIVFTLPVSIKNVVDFTFVYSIEVKDSYKLALDHFLHNFFVSVAYLNFSMNFYLYCLTGQRFRREFLKLMSGLDLYTRSSKT